MTTMEPAMQQILMDSAPIVIKEQTAAKAETGPVLEVERQKDLVRLHFREDVDLEKSIWLWNGTQSKDLELIMNKEGHWNLSYELKNSKGEVLESSEQEFVLDHSKPVISWNAGSEELWLFQPRDLLFQVTDSSLQAVQVWIDGAPVASDGLLHLLPSMKEVVIAAKDSFGNEARKTLAIHSIANVVSSWAAKETYENLNSHLSFELEGDWSGMQLEIQGANYTETKPFTSGQMDLKLPAGTYSISLMHPQAGKVQSWTIFQAETSGENQNDEMNPDQPGVEEDNKTPEENAGEITGDETIKDEENDSKEEEANDPEPVKPQPEKPDVQKPKPEKPEEDSKAEEETNEPVKDIQPEEDVKKPSLSVSQIKKPVDQKLDKLEVLQSSFGTLSWKPVLALPEKLNLSTLYSNKTLALKEDKVSVNKLNTTLESGSNSPTAVSEVTLPKLSASAISLSAKKLESLNEKPSLFLSESAGGQNALAAENLNLPANEKTAPLQAAEISTAAKTPNLLAKAVSGSLEGLNQGLTSLLNGSGIRSGMSNPAANYYRDSEGTLQTRQKARSSQQVYLFQNGKDVSSLKLEAGSNLQLYVKQDQPVNVAINGVRQEDLVQKEDGLGQSYIEIPVSEKRMQVEVFEEGSDTPLYSRNLKTFSITDSFMASNALGGMGLAGYLFVQNGKGRKKWKRS